MNDHLGGELSILHGCVEQHAGVQHAGVLAARHQLRQNWKFLLILGNWLGTILNFKFIARVEHGLQCRPLRVLDMAPRHGRDQPPYVCVVSL